MSNLHQIDRAIIEVQKPEAIAHEAIHSIEKFSTGQRISIVTFDWEQETATVLATEGLAKQTIGKQTQTPLTIWQDVITQIQDRESDSHYLDIVYEVSNSVAIAL